MEGNKDAKLSAISPVGYSLKLKLKYIASGLTCIQYVPTCMCFIFRDDSQTPQILPIE